VADSGRGRFFRTEVEIAGIGTYGRVARAPSRRARNVIGRLLVDDNGHDGSNAWSVVIGRASSVYPHFPRNAWRPEVR